MRFGRLVVLDKIREKKRIYFVCKCDCGNIKKIRRDSLVSGVTVSCGCFGREQRSKATKKHGLSQGSNTPHPLYRVWDSMIQRCSNQKNSSYHLYGGRGINVCDEWRHDFESFYLWSMRNGYQKGKQIDRIDNNKGYSLSNCRWVTPAQNARNKRTNIFVEFLGETMCLQDIANITNIDRGTLLYRLQKGKPLLQEKNSRGLI